MKLNVLIIAILSIGIISCESNSKKDSTPSNTNEATTPAAETDPLKDKGVGPIKSITLGEIDQAMADKGKTVFEAKCSACHKISKRYIGPALAGVTERRTPEWIMNMILNPEKMIVENPTAKKLLTEYNAPMANQHLTEEEARLILEYFRTKTSVATE